MERLNFHNIELECMSDYHDIRRAAQMMYNNKSLLLEILDDITIGDDFEFRPCESVVCGSIGLTSHHIGSHFGAIAGAILGHVSGGIYQMDSSSDTDEKVKQILANLRKATKRGDKDSANKVFLEFMKCSKESAVLCLMECLGSVNQEKREKIVGHIIGNHLDSEHLVSIEIMKRGDEQKKNKDQYAYYVCFRNRKNKDSRIVKFEHHASASIYVMCVIDRIIRRNKCKPIDILKNIELLQKVHAKIFTADGTNVRGLGNIVGIDNSSKYSTFEKNRLSQYYTDINNTISNAIHEWDFVLPYRCDSSTSIKLNPDFITVPKEIIPKDWIIRD